MQDQEKLEYQVAETTKQCIVGFKEECRTSFSVLTLGGKLGCNPKGGSLQITEVPASSSHLHILRDYCYVFSGKRRSKYYTNMVCI